VNVADDLSLSVNPPGHLERGVTIVIKCMIRYSGPRTRRHVNPDQDPSLTLTLDNETLPTRHMHYQARGNTNNIRTKILVSF